MRKAIALAAILLVAGCVATRARAVDSRTIMISAQGGTYHTQADLFASGVRRAAIAAQERGFEYFAVVDQTSSSHTNTAYIPPSAYYPGSFSMSQTPDMGMMVRLFHTGEVDPATPGVFATADVLAQR